MIEPSSIYADADPAVMRIARELDPDAFAAEGTTRHCGTSARRLRAYDEARRRLGIVDEFGNFVKADKTT